LAVQDNPHCSLLKNNEGKVFRLAFSDGEIAIAKILHVNDEYEDFIYDLISSTKVREHYKDKEQNCYVSKFNELISVELES
jgi:hypothetical protein